MPKFYKYIPISDEYTVYHPVLPEPAEDQPGTMDLGEVDGYRYTCIPDWMHPLQAQPVELIEVTPTTGLITSIFAKSGLLKLIKARMSGDQPLVRYSLQDELTVSQVYDWLPPGLMRHIEAGREWAQ